MGESSFLDDKFNRYLTIALILMGLIFLALEYTVPKPVVPPANLTIDYFYSPTCSHCAQQAPFNEQLIQQFPDVRFVKHDVTVADESRLLLIMAQNFSLGPESLGTPTTFVENKIFIGFESDNTTGAQITLAIQECLGAAGCGKKEIIQGSSTSIGKGIDLPLFGRTDLSSLSLPILAIVLGLIDGFNPCAMWVLVYLISLTMNMNDKRRLVLIVGTFLLASGILYFLFMTAWLNAFLFIGYVRAVTIIVGLIALGGGILSIKEYLDTKGEMVCKVTGAEDKGKIAKQMKTLVSKPLTWATIIGLIILAFSINSIEFMCSAAIPAVFTQILALSNLQTWQYYAYIALYDLAFMFDDLLIFGSVLLITSNTAGEKYAKYCKIIGGLIMFVLGIMLLFAPQLLH